MATIFDTAECTRLLTEVWREWQMTKRILLFLGVVMSFAGFYAASRLSFSESGPWIISACFVGVSGLLIAAYALVLFWLSSRAQAERNATNRRNASRSDSNQYLLFFRNSSPSQPAVCVHAPSSSKGLFNETNKV